MLGVWVPPSVYLSWSRQLSLPCCFCYDACLVFGQIICHSHTILFHIVFVLSVSENGYFVFPLDELHNRRLRLSIPAFGLHGERERYYPASIFFVLPLSWEHPKQPWHRRRNPHNLRCGGIPYIRRLSLLENPSSLSTSDFRLAISFPYALNCRWDSAYVIPVFFTGIEQVAHVSVGILYCWGQSDTSSPVCCTSRQFLHTSFSPVLCQSWWSPGPLASGSC